MEWWVYSDGEVSDRPLSRNELNEKEYITEETYVCRIDRESWVHAGEDPDLEGLFEGEEDQLAEGELELDEGSGDRATSGHNVDQLSSETRETTPDTAETTEDTTASGGGDGRNPQQTETTAAVADPEHYSSIAASFWRRPMAFLLDLGIFYAAFWVGSRYYRTELIQLEVTGILLGFTTFFLYLAVFNSRLGGSSSIGKKILGLRVRDVRGGFLSFYASFARYLILLLPAVIWSLLFTRFLVNLPHVVSVAFGLIALFFGVATLYLFLFNRYRRSLHDCVTRSAAVTEPPRKILDFTFWRGHFYFIIVLIGLVIGGGLGVLNHYGGTDSIVKVQESILEDPRVLSAGVPIYRDLFVDRDPAPQTLYVNTWIKSPAGNREELKEKILGKVLNRSSLVDRYEFIQVEIGTGLNLGLYSDIDYEPDVRPVEEWDKFLEEANG